MMDFEHTPAPGALFQGERRIEFRCTCMNRLAFGSMQWDAKQQKNRVQCGQCGKWTDLGRKVDVEEYRKLKEAMNGS